MSALRRSLLKAHKIDKTHGKSDEQYQIDLTLSSPTMLGNTGRGSKMNRHDSGKSPIAFKDGGKIVGKQVGVIVKDQSHLMNAYG